MGVKRQLFNIYSKNLYDLVCQFAKKQLGGGFDKDKLTLVFPDLEEHIQVRENNIFQCPLCKRYFATKKPEAKIDFKEFGLTIEHVPPECMGDLIKTMTCKECNNYLGSLEGKLEKSLTRKNEWEEEGLIKARLSFEDREREIGLDVELKEEGEWHFHTIEEISNKQAIEELMELISEGFDFTLHAYSPDVDRRKLIAVLYKNALLIAFYVFGYAYTESPSAENVISQILNPEKAIIPPQSVAILNNISADLSYPLVGWGYEPVKALYITFPLEINDNRKLYTVPLPGPGAEEVFNNFIGGLNGRIPGEEVNFKLHHPYVVPAGNSLELVKEFGTKAVYGFWQGIT